MPFHGVAVQKENKIKKTISLFIASPQICEQNDKTSTKFSSFVFVVSR